MSFDARKLLVPLLALAVLVVVGLQTRDAIRRAGLWSAKPRAAAVPSADPFAQLEAQLAAAGQGPSLSALRDPFAFGRAPEPGRRVVARPPAPPPPPRPVLTAIVADNDPRALIRYDDQNYTVKTGDTFAGFRVISITRDLVILDKSGERIALSRPVKGE